MRIESDPVGGLGSGSKSDDIELPDRSQERSNKGRRFPRLGLDALFHESRPSQDLTGDGTVEFYKVYKRRWFGLAQLTLLNIVVSWDVSSIYSRHSPVLSTARDPVRCDSLCWNCGLVLDCNRSKCFIEAVKRMQFCHSGPRPPTHTCGSCIVRGCMSGVALYLRRET